MALAAANGVRAGSKPITAADPIRIVLFAVLFVIAIALGAAASRGLLRLPYAGMTAADVSDEIDALSNDNPGAGAMFGALKAHYPATYEALTARAADAIRNGDAKGAEAAAFDTTRALSRAKIAYLPHASPEKLLDWGKSALAVMNAAKSDAPKLCAEVAFGAVEREAATAAPSLANAVGRQAAAAIIAFHEGETAPHNYARPGPADQRAFASAVAAQGMSPQDAKTLGSMAAVRGLPDAAQCALGIKLMRGVIATPEPVRSRILSAMAAEAAHQL